MPPAVHVDPFHGCEHCYFIAELLQRPKFPVHDLLNGVWPLWSLGRHQVVVAKVALRQLQGALVSCGVHLLQSDVFRWTT